MFTIIGGDGKEYGPATVEQLRSWINAGRANLETQARAVGTNEWHRLGDFAEFAPEGSLPPVIPAFEAPPAYTSAPAYASAPAGSTPPRLAGRGVRLGAAFIDGVLTWLCWLPTSTVVARSMVAQIQSGDFSPDLFVTAFTHAMYRSLPFLLVLAIVQGFLLTTRGQSVGKALCRIRIVRHADNSAPGFVHAFLLRGTVPLVLEQVPILGRLFWIVDACFIFGDARRCVHDYIAGTKVVEAE